jgi:3-phosphoshikimate 1-carboxyvinyltransferase
LAAEKHIPLIKLPGSKSISNRLLMIKAIGKLNFSIENLSDSDDTRLLANALYDINEETPEINIGDAGTDMRFLCSYLSCLENKTFILTGSARMKERPIKELVDSLKSIGAHITYLEESGYPPIKIEGKKLAPDEIRIKADVSSQFISSVLLTAPLFKRTCKLILEGEIVSAPYIHTTIHLLRHFGIDVVWTRDTITVKEGTYRTDLSSFYNEGDWSAASYFYCGLLASKFDKIELEGLQKESIQADAKVKDLFDMFGIQTSFANNKVVLTKQEKHFQNFAADFTTCPDVAQTMAVACYIKHVTADLMGLKTLKIKETDRIQAMVNELKKFGAVVHASEETLHLRGFGHTRREEDILVNTYNDHRMAMSFAPLKFLFPNLLIENKEVVSKSFPKFWEEFAKLQ